MLIVNYLFVRRIHNINKRDIAARCNCVNIYRCVRIPDGLGDEATSY